MLPPCLILPWSIRSTNSSTSSHCESSPKSLYSPNHSFKRWKRLLLSFSSKSKKSLHMLSMRTRENKESPQHTLEDLIVKDELVEEYDKSYLEEEAAMRRKLEEEYTRGSSVWSSSSVMLWQRTILMGEKCVPPQFSGMVLYDENGNPVEEFDASRSPCRATSVAPPKHLSR